MRYQRMSKQTLFQRIRPFVAYCAILIPIILIVTIIPSGIFTVQTKPPSLHSPISDTQATAKQQHFVAPSNKYQAGVLSGVDRSLDVKVVSAGAFTDMIATATAHPRKRKMTDLTKDPTSNSMQTLINTWIDGSYSPVHKHEDYSEVFVTLKGALAFFTFADDGTVTCNVIHDLTPSADRIIIVEKNQWHAMTAAPASMGWPGHAIVFESSGHEFNPTKVTKILAPFAPVYGDGMDGDPTFFQGILSKCPSFSAP